MGSDDQLIRLDNFKLVVSNRGLTPNDLTTQIGGRYTYWRDLLAGEKSFGEKIARKIEDKLGLQRYSLDDGSNPGGFVKLDSREREMVEQYRGLSKEARQLDLELTQFGERRNEAYQALLEKIEELRATLLDGLAPAPSARAGAKPKRAREGARQR